MAPLSRALRAELKSEERPQPSALALICPSALTLCALCCGMSAMRAASRGEFSGALVWLGLSAIADGLDGHAARRLNAVTAFGGELDSLCDLVDFGAAPTLVVYEWAEGKIVPLHLSCTNGPRSGMRGASARMPPVPNSLCARRLAGEGRREGGSARPG
mmetsp:Transcript_30348/g.76041  ORF Transcript_30348/g.76041 Transcript_30348/m.76041 type:complete len:159 (+) Transcript_30348:2-478(+)